MSDDLEKEIALYEAERNRAWHSWFAARGHIPPTDESTLIFDGGFRMAWELCRAKPAPQPAEQKPAPDVTQLVEALEEGLRAIGDHHAPGDCYATGPMTGDPFRDLVQCPACSFIAMCDDLLAAYREGGQR